VNVSSPNPAPSRSTRELMPSLRQSAEGMAAQMRFMEIISENIANAQTTRMADGMPYQRQVGVTERDPRTGEIAMRVENDPEPGRLVYDPGHPDANAEGFVEYPNVDVTTELVNLMVARRIHEANATVFQAAKSMLKKALEI
jgi:flagellar basal-body rod protein FlgC